MTRPLSFCCGWSGPGVKVTPEPARVVDSWKIGLNGAFGRMATTGSGSWSLLDTSPRQTRISLIYIGILRRASPTKQEE